MNKKLIPFISFALLLPVSHFQSALDNVESASGHHPAYDTDSLPSYTLVSGLPSYDDALECYRKVQGTTTKDRPSLMKLFSFDNQIMSKDAVSPGELQQVVVVETLTKDGLPSYQEASSAVAVVNEKKNFYKPNTPSSADEGTSLKSKFNFNPQKSWTAATTTGKKNVDLLPRIHKSPSLVVLMYDDDYWKNVHQQSSRLDDKLKLKNSYSSNSLPRNFSTQLMNEC